MAAADRKSLTRGELAQALVRLGVPRGGLMMVHSSLRSIGHVDGGAETVVDALLDALGPEGTLVVPTFTDDAAKRGADFVFDPLNTPSLAGAISEAARRRTGARRSLHHWHSVGAIGPLAETVATEVGASPWQPDGPMPKIIDLGGLFLLLGVPYQRLTLVHLMEWENGVPYRPGLQVELPMRRSDGSVVPLVNLECPPNRPFAGNDFNRLGQRMEDANVVKIGQVGNAVARLFYGADVRETASAMYGEDKSAFLIKNGVIARLAYGHTIDMPRGELCVVDPAEIFNAS